MDAQQWKRTSCYPVREVIEIVQGRVLEKEFTDTFNILDHLDFNHEKKLLSFRDPLRRALSLVGRGWLFRSPI
jgi:hypothetical protein